jgi:glycosyltransferase involved in cell wall biosynthesis
LSTPLRLSAVVPATNRPATLASCKAAIEAADAPPDELIVIEAPANAGPAYARNEGVERAQGDVVVFVDADVVVHHDAFVRIRKAFADDPELTAIFGSYDDMTVAADPVSAFRNLLHHAVHQDSAGEVVTFWAGLGAVRRATFLASGGFDAARYPRPSIEDIDLGMRLAGNGARIVLDPDIQGTHLKSWTLGAMLRTDLLDRASPWVALLLRQGTVPPQLNLGWRHRLSAAALLFAFGGLGIRRPLVALGGAAAFVGLNASFYKLVARKRGRSQAAVVVALHAAHHLAGMVAVPLGVIRFLSEDRADAPGRNLPNETRVD